MPLQGSAGALVRARYRPPGAWQVQRPRFLSVARAAAMLSVSEQLVFRRIAAEDFPAIRIAHEGRKGRLVVPARALDELEYVAGAPESVEPSSDPLSDAAPSRPFFRVGEAARLFGIHVQTLYRLIDDERFPAVRVGARIVVPAKPIDEMEQTTLRDWAVVEAADWVTDAAGSGRMRLGVVS